MEWLKKLKEGDKVIVSNIYKESICQITHVTKTQIHINNMKFRRTNGGLIGSDIGHYSKLKKATTNECIKIEAQNLKAELINIIDNTNLSELCNLTLNKIVNAIHDDKKINKKE